MNYCTLFYVSKFNIRYNKNQANITIECDFKIYELIFYVSKIVINNGDP